MFELLLPKVYKDQGMIEVVEQGIDAAIDQSAREARIHLPLTLREFPILSFGIFLKRPELLETTAVDLLQAVNENSGSEHAHVQRLLLLELMAMGMVFPSLFPRIAARRNVPHTYYVDWGTIALDLLADQTGDPAHAQRYREAIQHFEDFVVILACMRPESIQQVLALREQDANISSQELTMALSAFAYQ